MNVTFLTDDYDIITSSNYADFDSISALSNRRNNENNIDIIIPTLLLTIPSGL